MGFWRLVGGLVLGSAEFARRLLKQAKGNAREQKELKPLGGAISWDQMVKSVERQMEERWESFSTRYGDWGRDAALWLGRRMGRLRLRELGKLAGGIDYAAAGDGGGALWYADGASPPSANRLNESKTDCQMIRSDPNGTPAMARQHPDLVKRIPFPGKAQSNVEKIDNRGHAISGSCSCRN